MGILDLNYDTLAAICAFLRASDALSLALACRALAPAALARVAVRVACTSPTHLFQASRVLVRSSRPDAEPRARHVRSLRVTLEAMGRPGAGSVADVAGLVCAVRGAASIAVPLAAIVHDRPGAATATDPPARRALGEMRNLVRLELGWYDARVLGVLRGLPPRLEVLVLDAGARDRPVPTLREVLCALGGVRASLRALKVAALTDPPDADAEGEDGRGLPTFERVGTLYVAQKASPGFDVLGLFPRAEVVKVLGIALHRAGRELRGVRHLEVVPWNAIRLAPRLVRSSLPAEGGGRGAGGPSEARGAGEAGRDVREGAVRYLHLLGTARAENTHAFLDAAQAVAPRALQLVAVLDTGPEFWGALAGAVPRLRCLCLDLRRAVTPLAAGASAEGMRREAARWLVSWLLPMEG